MYLQPDYGRIVVAYDDGRTDAPALVAHVLDAFELTVPTSEPMTQVDAHHVLSLDGDSANAPGAVLRCASNPGLRSLRRHTLWWRAVTHCCCE